MAQEIKIARILTRTGMKSSLPQPLSPGEFGTALDTREVFIGLNPTLTTAGNNLPIITCYKNVINAQTHANQIISTYVYQINLSNPSLTIAQIELANDNNVTAGFTRRLTKVGARVYIAYEFKYTSNVLAIPVAPGTGLGTEVVFSAACGLDFSANTLDLSLLGTYTWNDTSAVASLMNFAFAKPDTTKSGIVNVDQNLRILTENDLINQTMPPAIVSLPANGSYVFAMPAHVMALNTHYVFDITVTAVNQTNNTNSISQFKIFVKRNSGNAEIGFIDRYYASPSSSINVTGSAISVSATVASDAADLVLTLTSTDSSVNLVSVTGKI